MELLKPQNVRGRAERIISHLRRGSPTKSVKRGERDRKLFVLKRFVIRPIPSCNRRAFKLVVYLPL